MKLFRLNLTFALILIFSFTSVAFADYSEDIAAIKTKIGDDAINKCHDNLTAGLDLEMQEFMKFLDTNFQNKSSNSSLTNIAITRYANFKFRIEALFGTLQVQPVDIETTNEYAAELNTWGNCKRLMDDYLALAKEKMIEKIKINTNQKKTVIMMEKFNTINQKLRGLNLEIAKMYGAFMTFKDKLPFFNQNCVTS